MKYRNHSELQNSYPKEPETVSQNYVDGKSDDDVVYNGKFPDNFITFSSTTVDDKVLGEINFVDNMEFRFIVDFGDNDYWTSRGFYNDLKDALEKNQPYFNKETVTLATVDYQLLTNYWQKEKFNGWVGTVDIDGTGEVYAEVTVTETLNTKMEMLDHINWLVSDKEELRPVSSFGKWETHITDFLGFDEQVIFRSGSENGISVDPEINNDRTVDRNSGAGGIDTDRDGVITGSDVPDGREVDRNTGSGGITDREDAIESNEDSDRRNSSNYFRSRR